MRALIDLVDSFTGMVRFAIGALFLFGFLVFLVLTAGATYVAPKVAEGASASANRFGELVAEEARSARRDRDLAADGWGYGSANGDQDRLRRSNSRDGFASDGYRSRGSDWGDDTE